MAFAYPGEGALDYSPCRYGESKLIFRGPAQALTGAYVAALGGTETYGKYVPDPYPALLAQAMGMAVVNLGCAQAGPDAYLHDPETLGIAGRARAAVVQVMGAQNLSNRYYSVHPRRNDRFLCASPLLRALFPKVDFTEFHFTRHLLSALRRAAPDRFDLVVAELRIVWVKRMKEMLSRLPTDLVLLWLGDRPPPARGLPDLDHDPLLVDQEMLAAIRPLAAVWVEVAGLGPAEGLVHGVMEPVPAVPGPASHRLAAEALAGALTRLISTDS